MKFLTLSFGCLGLVMPAQKKQWLQVSGVFARRISQIDLKNMAWSECVCKEKCFGVFSFVLFQHPAQQAEGEARLPLPAVVNRCLNRAMLKDGEGPSYGQKQTPYK